MNAKKWFAYVCSNSVLSFGIVLSSPNVAAIFCFDN